MLVKVKFANIINIAADEEIIPELLQSKCSPKNIYNIVNKLFKSLGSNSLKKYSVTIEKINKFEKEISNLSDLQLKEKTPYFKEQIINGSSLEKILPEAFAVVREVAKRTVKMRDFDVEWIVVVEFLSQHIHERNLVVSADTIPNRRFCSGRIYIFIRFRMDMTNHADQNNEQD